MITVHLKNLATSVRGLTQARRVAASEPHLSTSQAKRPVIFTQTYMGTMTGDYLFQLGTGEIDASLITKLLLQYSHDNQTDFVTLSTDFLDYVKVTSTDVELWRGVLALIMATGNKQIGTNRVAAVTPTYVLAQLEKFAAHPVHPLFTRLLTDMVCHLLRPLGWILNDAAYSYRVKKVNSYPMYSDLVDVVHATQLHSVISKLMISDLSVVSKAQSEKKAINPAMVATHVANALVTSHDAARGTYSSAQIVSSVLTVLSRIWSPTTPDALMPAARVLADSSINALQSNLAIFLAAQQMISESTSTQKIHFGDEEMITVVIPEFMKAMAETSPYKMRTLPSAVEFLAKKSSRDHMGNPSHAIIHEQWDVTPELTGFRPVRQARNGKQRYLFVDNAATDSLSSALEPIQDAMNLGKMADQIVASYDLINSTKMVSAGGGILTLGLPSIVEREYMAGVSVKDLISKITDGTWFPPSDDLSAGDHLVREVAFDYYSMLMHYAVHYSGGVVSTSVRDTEIGQPLPYLVWSISTSLKVPAGPNAIVGGMIDTSEPLEAVIYMTDHEALDSRRATPVKLSDFEKTVHVWDWHSGSKPLAFIAEYTTTVRGKTYTVTADEFELLALGVRRKDVRFLNPTITHAMVRLWLDWFRADKKALEHAARYTKDTVQKQAINGRLNRLAMNMLATLQSMGNQGIGARATGLISSRIAEQMYSQGAVDSYADIHVGLQRHRLEIWSGVVTMQLLDLLTLDEAEEIVQYIADSEVLTFYVGAVEQ